MNKKLKEEPSEYMIKALDQIFTKQLSSKKTKIRSFLELILNVVTSADDWMICENCIYVFCVDQKIAEKRVQEKDYVSSPPVVDLAKVFRLLSELTGLNQALL